MSIVHNLDLEEIIYAGIMRAPDRSRRRLELGKISREICAIDGWSHTVDTLWNVQICMMNRFDPHRECILEALDTALHCHNVIRDNCEVED
jgi:hypothetical protein